jgi:hypothetical protein
MDLRNILIGFGVAVTCFALQSCSEDEKGGLTPVNYNVNGKVEKGPFVSGSTIDIHRWMPICNPWEVFIPLQYPIIREVFLSDRRSSKHPCPAQGQWIFL